MSFQEAVAIAESILTVPPDPDEIHAVLIYTERKCQMNGLGEAGVRLIIADEIRNYLIRQVSEEWYQAIAEGRESQCVSFA